MTRRGVAMALAGTLALLLAHALFYRFLCDDAFISFRYADNLAQGHGLVFNPGGARVEGYTNFLWVVVLAAFDLAGIRPDSSAPVLGLLLTVALWSLVARASWRLVAPVAPWPFAIVAPAALAITRSVAVWSTSGLETRLFEVLVVAGVLRIVEEAEVPGLRPWGAVVLALASLTRPDGVLVSACVLAAAAARLLSARPARWRTLATWAGLYAAIVGGHLLFRVLYYGAWVPNTYHAKVGGRSWWGMGAAYLASYAVEYAVVLWVPLVVLGARALVRDGRALTVLAAGAAVLPHALYVASIGGDHFEYRPLDLYFPFAFLVVGRGLAALAGTMPRRRVIAAAYAAAVAAGLVVLPAMSHLQFPDRYTAGYPGRAPVRADRDGFLVRAWPLRKLLDVTTGSLVGVRQEEHALFLQGVVSQGRALRQLVEEGKLPKETHIAICAVGAIPYYSGLTTLDRLGLTDAVVARQPAGATRLMAHERFATFGYAAEAGTDLWSVHPYFLLFRLDDDALLTHIDFARADGDEAFVADAGEDRALMVLFPRGPETAARFPNLSFRSTSDPTVSRDLLDRIVAACRSSLERDPRRTGPRRALASALKASGRMDEALTEFRELARVDDEEGWYNVGTILAERGDYAPAIEALRRATILDPTLAPARHNLGMALAKTSRFDEALVELREAVRLESDSPRSLFALGAVALAAGDRAEAGICRARLEALGTPAASALAQRLGAALGP